MGLTHTGSRRPTPLALPSEGRAQRSPPEHRALLATPSGAVQGVEAGFGAVHPSQPRVANKPAMDSSRLAEWWESRWRRYTNNHFGVIMRFWRRVHGVGQTEMGGVFSAVSNGMGERAAGLAGQVETLQSLLGRHISSDGARGLMTEIDQHSDGPGAGLVDRREAMRWW